MAMSGVRNSWATSVVRRRSRSRSFSTDSAMTSKVSPSRATSSSPMARAVFIMRLIGDTKLRAKRKPMQDASTMATPPAMNMAWYELSRNS